MEELTIKKEELTNKELKNYTTKLKTCGDNIRKNYIKISFLLNEIDNSECYLDDGFESVQDYASKVLNIQKTTCYNLLKIAKEFINEEGTRTVLTESGSDYGVSQLQILLSLGVEKAKELHDNETISPSMSVRQLKNAIKEETETWVEDSEEDSEDVIDTDSETISEEIIEPIASAQFFEDGSIAWNFPEGWEDFEKKVEKIFENWNPSK